MTAARACQKDRRGRGADGQRRMAASRGSPAGKDEHHDGGEPDQRQHGRAGALPVRGRARVAIACAAKRLEPRRGEQGEAELRHQQHAARCAEPRDRRKSQVEREQRRQRSEREGHGEGAEDERPQDERTEAAGDQGGGHESEADDAEREPAAGDRLPREERERGAASERPSEREHRAQVELPRRARSRLGHLQCREELHGGGEDAENEAAREEDPGGDPAPRPGPLAEKESHQEGRPRVHHVRRRLGVTGEEARRRGQAQQAHRATASLSSEAEHRDAAERQPGGRLELRWAVDQVRKDAAQGEEHRGKQGGGGAEARLACKPDRRECGEDEMQEARRGHGERPGKDEVEDVRRVEESALQRSQPRDAAQHVRVPERKGAGGEPAVRDLVRGEKQQVRVDAAEGVRLRGEHDPDQPEERDHADDQKHRPSLAPGIAGAVPHPRSNRGAHLTGQPPRVDGLARRN